ncbi:putative inorganic polyphosphate/ATP-NAD kinase [Microbulbifer aggregans]|uniref:NAD kinase n=1 Tax=Microbulbifer aggregans TaxID=1769779 RepID=A0A1C9W9I0_9GAMM|nr:NAD(+) kinase [Microbulbifer aggregans]AOS97763.1 putative inorganic polyphosphate/ATP-NAD kinase [Microbulbifer aggregans]
MSEFQNIGLIGRTESDSAVLSLKRLMAFLEREGFSVVLEKETATAVPGHSARVSSKDKLGELCDLVIVVGGDGSLLGAARALAKYSVPLLGINRGRLGFLTDITPDEIEQKVGEVLAGKYMAESRFLLDMSVTRDGKPVGKGSALNDVVIHPGEFIRMIEFDLYIDGQFVYKQRSDGLIISTPTGSTAYALSGGGPIMHPKLDAISVVPLNPHTLSSRPIVVEGSSEFKVVVGEHNVAKPHVTCDGHDQVVTEPGDVVRIHKKPHRLTLIHPIDHNFYETCRTKLGWQVGG